MVATLESFAGRSATVDELRHRIMGAVAMLATLARDRGTHHVDLRELNADILRLARLAAENTESLIPNP